MKPEIGAGIMRLCFRTRSLAPSLASRGKILPTGKLLSREMIARRRWCPLFVGARRALLSWVAAC
jgi:hypothetical protein